MITFKINKKPYQFPTQWEDVSYSQYLKLLTAAKVTDQIAIFSGIPKETLEKAELVNLEKVIKALSFLNDVPIFQRTKMVGPYVMPADITIQSTGQFEDLRALLLKMPDNPMQDQEKYADLCLKACAIYCQKVKDGRYDSDKTDAVAEELKNYPCAEVIGTGAFFLFRPLLLSRSIMNLSPTPYRRLRRLIRALPGYQKTSDFLQRWFGLAER